MGIKMRGLLSALLFTPLSLSPAQAGPLAYPTTKSGDVKDHVFGRTIKDPYRWLENDIRHDPAVREWVDAQNKVTQAYLAALPRRDEIRSRLTQLWNFERFSAPVKRGGRYFFNHNSGLQRQSLLYFQESLDEQPRIVLDPNSWSTDGTSALDVWSASEDGHRVAFYVQEGGSDWRTAKFVQVDNGKILDDRVRWIKNSELGWAKDGSGIFYSRYPEPAAGQEFQSQSNNQAVYFHRIGTPQSADQLIYSTPDQPTHNHFAQVTADGRWLVITTWRNSEHRFRITVKDLATAGAEPRSLVPEFANSWWLVGSVGTKIIFVTDKDAPRSRVVSLDAALSAPVAQAIVSEDRDTVRSATIVGSDLLVTYLKDAKSLVRRFGTDGSPRGSVALPGIGTVSSVTGRPNNPEGFYSFETINLPPTIYRYDAATNRSSVFKAPNLVFDPKLYDVQQHFYSSLDGTQVPMFVAQRKGRCQRRGAPALLTGYGGFNIPVTPGFSTMQLAWMELGGVVAIANIRGGGEYGKAWHEAGRLANKQNGFNDFIAAAEYLISDGLSARRRVAIEGGSNGGLLIAAVVNQRPGLFAAAMPAVGVMDMLRFNKFTAGRYWMSDYGDPSKEEDFRHLIAYSPYHNIKGGNGRVYPAIMITTADTDDRVVPAHSFKYAAALQAAQIGDKPHLIRIETQAGHGGGKPTDKAIAETADRLTFAAFHSGLIGKDGSHWQDSGRCP